MCCVLQINLPGGGSIGLGDVLADPGGVFDGGAGGAGEVNPVDAAATQFDQQTAAGLLYAAGLFGAGALLS